MSEFAAKTFGFYFLDKKPKVGHQHLVIWSISYMNQFITGREGTRWCHVMNHSENDLLGGLLGLRTLLPHFRKPM